jgi:hypothetical protein
MESRRPGRWWVKVSGFGGVGLRFNGLREPKGDAGEMIGQVEREGPLVGSHVDLVGGGSRYRGLGVEGD